MNKENKLIIKTKLPKGEDGYKIFSVRIQTDMLKQIDDISTHTGRSRNELVTLLLDYALNNYEIEE